MLVLVLQGCLTISCETEQQYFVGAKENKFGVKFGVHFVFSAQAKMLNLFALKFVGTIWMWLTTHKILSWFFWHFKNYFWAREHVLPGAELNFRSTLVFRCIVASQTWKIMAAILAIPMPCCFYDLSHCWKKDKKVVVVNIFTSTTLWGLWLLRNKFVFQGEA